jgi:sialate O-acetylesterase
MRLLKNGLLLSGFIFISCFASAQVRLPQLVGDSMVLQRDIALKIWGWSAPNEKISIRFRDKNYAVKADEKGNWLLTLPAQTAGGPFTMDIKASNTIQLKDILVGDVWFCSGQSNMVNPMERVKERFPEDIADNNYPQIRNFFIPTAADVKAIHDDLPISHWKATNAKNILEFGSVSWFFARDLYKRYKIPIGIINSSVGGTPIQAWIGAEGFQSMPKYANRLLQFKDDPDANKIPANRQPASRPFPATPPDPDKGSTEIPNWSDPAYVPERWHDYWLPGYWADQGVKGLNGVVWFRKEIDVPAEMTGVPAKLMLGRIVDADQAWVNGVKVGNITYQYPPRRYDVPAGLLKPGKNLIVVRITNTAGKGGFVPDKPYFLAANGKTIDLRGQWQYKVGQVFSPGPGGFGGGGGINAQNEPTGLYNTMVAPAIQYAVKGFLWYQGEANAGSPGDYYALMKALVTDWRQRWQLGELPFLWVQLPNYQEVQYSPVESQWAEIREAQLQALQLPNTGMAVAIDLGEWNDIHPLNKKDVGLRLALQARQKVYGEKELVASGPLFKEAVIEGNEIRIHFTETGSGLALTNGKSPEQFAIAGADKKFVWAKARIDGNTVVVSSEKIPQPKYVRYAWADNPENPNLCNKEGLPASPFRTDTQQ